MAYHDLTVLRNKLEASTSGSSDGDRKSLRKQKTCRDSPPIHDILHDRRAVENGDINAISAFSTPRTFRGGVLRKGKALARSKAFHASLRKRQKPTAVFRHGSWSNSCTGSQYWMNTKSSQTSIRNPDTDIRKWALLSSWTTIAKLLKVFNSFEDFVGLSASQRK